MPLFMYQAAYSVDSWAAQVRNPQNRVETVGRQLCEAGGGKFVGGWLCFGDYDLVIIAEVPNNESMAAIALAIALGTLAVGLLLYLALAPIRAPDDSFDERLREPLRLGDDPSPKYQPL